jgi:hypothetical protein
VNRTPPRPEVAAGLTVPPEKLAVVGTLARTYDAQRLRLLERAGHSVTADSDSPLRPLTSLEPAMMLDGRAVSASIVDAVSKAEAFTRRPVALPLLVGSAELMAAEAGWWDALLGDIERRSGLPPRAIGVALPPDAPPAVRAIFAERACP